MKILAIRLARFGDIVLLLPALNYLKARLPGSKLTFLTDCRWAPLATMCPAVDEVMAIDRLGMRDGSRWKALAEMRRLAADLRQRKFDAAIDFHGFRETNLIAWCSGAAQRLGLQRFDQSFLRFCFNLPPVVEDKDLHVSEVFLRVAGSFPGPTVEAKVSSAVVLPELARRWAAENLPARPYAVLYVDAPVPDRTWPLERFFVLADHIRSMGLSVALVSGMKAIEAPPSGKVRVYSGLTIPQLAGLISSARLLVSNDTGPMHLGPLLSVPTLGIFSVGIPRHFRPTGLHDRFIQGNPIDRVETKSVIDEVNQLWAATGR